MWGGLPNLRPIANRPLSEQPPLLTRITVNLPDALLPEE